MLILTVRTGETTTITTPDGQRLSVVFIGRSNHHEDIRLGVNAPDDYQILRSALYERLLDTLHCTPLYQVAGRDCPVNLIADYNEEMALKHYRRRYPKSSGIEVQPVCDRYQHPGYQSLETCWLRQGELPIAVEIEAPL